MVFVEQLVSRMRGVRQLCQFSAQHINLAFIQHPDACDVAMFTIKLDLLAAQPILLPRFSPGRAGEEVCQLMMKCGEINYQELSTL